jgi:orotidine-5'-phosphate decarboxylase
MLDSVREHNSGVEPQGSVGVVVGATIGSTQEDLAINGPLLVPGLGAQGGGGSDLRRIFGAVAGNVVHSVSREVLRAGPDSGALAAAAERAAGEYASALG